MATYRRCRRLARLQELLFDAARLRLLDMIAILLDAGSSITAPDAKGYNPLITRWAPRACFRRAGAPIDQPDGARGDTALMNVGFKGYLPIAEMLLAAGANPHAVNRAGQTALMFASLISHDDIVD